MGLRVWFSGWSLWMMWFKYNTMIVGLRVWVSGGTSLLMRWKLGFKFPPRILLRIRFVITMMIVWWHWFRHIGKKNPPIVWRTALIPSTFFFVSFDLCPPYLFVLFPLVCSPYNFMSRNNICFCSLSNIELYLVEV